MEGNNNFSPADWAAMGNNGNNNEWLWIILFFLFAGNGNGFGGNRGNCATTEDVQNQFNFAALERQNNETVAAVTRNTYDINNALKDSELRLFGQLAGINLGQQSIQDTLCKCCCDIQRAIDGVNFNGVMNTQKVLDMLSGNRMQDMQEKINNLQRQVEMCGIVRYPTNIAYSIPAPCFPQVNPCQPCNPCC